MDSNRGTVASGPHVGAFPLLYFIPAQHGNVPPLSASGRRTQVVPSRRRSPVGALSHSFLHLACRGRLHPPFPPPLISAHSRLYKQSVAHVFSLFASLSSVSFPPLQSTPSPPPPITHRLRLATQSTRSHRPLAGF
jgi:hypothetical protein